MATFTGNQNDNYLTGTDTVDDMHGGEGKDALYGLGGDDTLYGDGGNDTLDGGNGADKLFGGLGDDTLDGGAGVDTLDGGEGNDSYYVDNALDSIVETGAGIDTVYASISWSLPENVENLVLREGWPAYTGRGNYGDNLIIGNSANNFLYGMYGADRLEGGAGNDLLDGGDDPVQDALYGGAGDDTYHVYLVKTGNVLLADGSEYGVEYRYAFDVCFDAESNGGLDTVVLHSVYGEAFSMSLWAPMVENLVLFDDISLYSAAVTSVFGNNLANDITGRAGAEEFFGGAGNDRLYGLGGSDALYGEAGNDILDGGAGGDRMYGGAGSDTYYVSSDQMQFDSLGNQIVDRLVEHESIQDSTGYGGLDTVISAADDWTLGSYFENLTLAGTNSISGTGNSLNNTLTGNAGNNALSGGAGNDTLIGNAGSDRLTGGTGSDRFVFKKLTDSVTGTNRDVIVDFAGGGSASGDVIDLSAIDAITGNAIHDSFNYIGGNAFSGAGQLRYANGILQGSTDADFAAEFEIQLLGAPSLYVSTGTGSDLKLIYQQEAFL